MKKSTKLLAILLTLVMVAGLFTACGSKETKTGNKTTDTSVDLKDTPPADQTNKESKTTKAHTEQTNTATADETKAKTEPEQTDAPKASKEPGSSEKVLENGVVAIDWAPYNKLIADIKEESDPVVRERLMHEAEDMLMETGIYAPLTNFNNFYLMNDDVEGVYATLSGERYFMFASKGDAESLRINLIGEPARLDPALIISTDGGILALHTFAGLYTYGKNGELVPDLAEGVEISKDGLTYTFTLKPNLKWSDGHGGIFKTNDQDYTYPVGDGYFTTGMNEAKAIELLEGGRICL